MGGIGLLLNTAKDALLTQQFAINVVSHNIANVSTEGYSRQTPVIESKMPAPLSGFVFGRGVELQEILRNTDNFIETRLRERNSDLMAMNEKEVYMSVLEGLFNESSEGNLSTQFSQFWNSWHDLANNPSGLAERSILYETGFLLAQGFSDLRDDLNLFEQEINMSIDAGIDKINEITSQIAELNNQIIELEVHGSANDLRDQRNTLLNRLSEYIGIRVHSDSDGLLTITTSSGHTLLSKTESYLLVFENGRVQWEASGGNQLDITEKVTGGKLAGWLDTRDEIIPKYMDELDELAKAFILEVNKFHSQGVGLQGFTSVTGAYQAASTSQGMGIPGSSGAGLAFYNGLHKSTFTGEVDLSALAGGLGANETLEIYEGGNTVSVALTAGDDIDQIVTSIQTALDAAEVSITASKATGSSGEEYLVLTHDNASDGSTFGLGRAAGDNDELGLDENFMFWVDDGDPGTAPVQTTIHVNSSTTMEDFRDAVNAIGIEDIDASITSGRLHITATGGYSFYFSDDTSNVLATVGINTFFAGTDALSIEMNAALNSHKELIAAGRASSSGEIVAGDNTNANAIVNLQYQEVSIRRWTYERDSTTTWRNVTDTFENYYHYMIGSMGIKSQSIKREKEYNEVIVNQLNEKRDAISAVSIDEEMTNLIKYQHAYATAAKLVSIADEMLEMIIETR
jgi:flagellar hook-associated protein FlgK